VLGKLDTRKDTAQVAIESAFDHVGRIASIIASAGRDVTREIGDWATEMIEMREAGRRAHADRERADRASAPGPPATPDEVAPRDT
jgi:hypothetical protein